MVNMNLNLPQAFQALQVFPTKPSITSNKPQIKNGKLKPYIGLPLQNAGTGANVTLCLIIFSLSQIVANFIYLC